MRTNKKISSWRKNLPVLPESLREEESDGDNSSADVSRTFLKRSSPASFDSYSPDNDKETDSNESESVNRVKCAARGKRSERDGEAYGKSDMSMI